MRTLAALFVLLLVAACQTAPPPEMSGAEAIQELAPLERAFGAAMMEGDLEAVLNLYTSDAVEIVPGRYRTRTEIVSDYVEGLRTLSFSAWESEPLFAWVHGDVGYKISRIEYDFGAEGENPATDELYTFMRLAEENGEWKIHRSLVGNRDAPPDEMTEAQTAQIQAEVMAFAESRARAFSEVNADRLMEDWYDHNITEVSFAERVVGREATAAFYEDLVSRWGSAEQEWTPGSTVDVISPMVALFQGTATFTSTDSEGTANSLQSLHVTQLLRMVDGRWKTMRIVRAASMAKSE